MTDYSDLIQPDKGQDARAIHIVDKPGYDQWLKGRSARELSTHKPAHNVRIATIDNQQHVAQNAPDEH